MLQSLVQLAPGRLVASWRTHLRFGFMPTVTVLAARLFGRTFFKEELADQLESVH